MSDSLPARPDLGQLRRRAKELRDAARQGEESALARFTRHLSIQPDAVSLATAQLVIARELGFASWPRLKAAIDAGRSVSAFLAASTGRRPRLALDILRADPAIAHRDLLVATVLGDADAVRAAIEINPEVAVAIDDERGWPPLLYACYSRWHQLDPTRASGLADVVRALLEAGANPNTNDGGRPQFHSALMGSVDLNNPDIAEVLLDAGAHPDPGQPIGVATGYPDHRCLTLLLAHGARVSGTWAVDGAIDADDPVALSLLLNALGSDAARERATQALPEATAEASLPVVETLLDAGADPRAETDGISALRKAIRAGKNDVAARLRAAGAVEDDTDVDRFLGACLNGDRDTATRLPAGHPDLSDSDRVLIVDAAGSRPAEAIALMLDVGFSHAARNHLGEQPLHTAAYNGNAPVVRLLLEAGADVDARDARFDATPLAFATVGSREQAGKPGDWLATVRLLIDAGASRREVWITGKPPSEEVIVLLSDYGVGPDETPEPEPEPEDDDLPGELGTGVLPEMARHLQAAYEDRDLDLLASLLHPEVRWSGMCTNRTQVMDWFRQVAAEGTLPTVRGIEVDRDAVLMALSVTRPAEGARPAPPQQVYQVFTVDDAQVIDIRGYPDRRSALARGEHDHD
ncbi:MAG TPA: ankyrin repeat domain-containing protein [Pseudonocardiaceae bacterium]